MGRGLMGALEAGGWLLVAVLALLFLRPALRMLLRRRAPPATPHDPAKLDDALPAPRDTGRRQARAYLKSLERKASARNGSDPDRPENG